MPEVVPIPQGATVGYESQSASPAPAGQPASGAGVVPIPEGATVGYGDEPKTAPAATAPKEDFLSKTEGVIDTATKDIAGMGAGALSTIVAPASHLYDAVQHVRNGRYADAGMSILKSLHASQGGEVADAQIKSSAQAKDRMLEAIKAKNYTAAAQHAAGVVPGASQVDDAMTNYQKEPSRDNLVHLVTTALPMLLPGMIKGAGAVKEALPATEAAATEAGAGEAAATPKPAGYVQQVLKGEKVAQPPAENAFRKAASTEPPTVEAATEAAVEPIPAGKPSPIYENHKLGDPISLDLPKETGLIGARYPILDADGKVVGSITATREAGVPNAPVHITGIGSGVSDLTNKLGPANVRQFMRTIASDAGSDTVGGMRVGGRAGKNIAGGGKEVSHKVTPAATPAGEGEVTTKAPAETAKVSLRKVMQPSVDKAFADAKALYKPIDDAAGTDFKGLYDKLDAALDRERLTSPNSPEQAKAELDIKNTRDAIDDARVRASKSGIPDVDKALDQADAKFTEAQANKDLNAKLFNNQGVIKGNIAHGVEESINIDRALDVLEDMDKPNKYGPSRLNQTSLGKDGAFKLKQDLYDAQKLGQEAMSKQQFVKRLVRYGLYSAGAGMSAHFLIH